MLQVDVLKMVGPAGVTNYPHLALTGNLLFL